MMLFSEYTDLFMQWVEHHPEWALLLAFFISFIESLAFIGSIVPGSVMMTFLGILAGSGLMRIDLTLCASILGAIIGDGASYSLGYYFSEHLPERWPFNRYPKWLTYGQLYFERHGGKSVFFGRFIGPLRSIIPVIAGMMHMNRSSFFLANSLSAIPWAMVYVAPGIFIGIAGSELSPEQSKQLFLIIIGLLLAIWILSLVLKSLWQSIQKKTTYSFYQKTILILVFIVLIIIS